MTASQQKHHCHSGGEAAPARTTPTGPDAVLGGYTFDPFDIPFLPLWPELPAVYPNFAGETRQGCFERLQSIEGVDAPCAKNQCNRSKKL